MRVWFWGKDEREDFREFYAKWASTVFTFCQLYLGDEVRAEEASQNAFMAYFRNGNELQMERVALSLLHYAREAADEIPPSRNDPRGRAEELEDVLAMLPPDQRAVFILRGVLGLAPSEVAVAAGLTTDRAERLWSESLLKMRGMWLNKP